MTSMKTMTNMFNSDINTEFIRYMKYVGVLESPNNIIKYSYNPYLMANAVLGMLKDRRRRLVGGGGVNESQLKFLKGT
jgi:hypothetical protein